MGHFFSTRNEKLYRTALQPLQQCNSELNHQEYLAQQVVLTSYPRRIVFELTNRCNFRCIMCGREAATFSGCDLPLAVIRRFADCFRRCEEVTLHGWGEGTLHPQFEEILAYLDTFPGLRKYFVTNGSTLERIREAVLRHHVDLIALSLDGASAAVNDSIRRNGSLERQLASLRELLRARDARGLAFPYVNFVFTAMRRNLHELPALIDLAQEIGVPEVKVVYLTIFSPELLAESLIDHPQEVRQVFAEAERQAARLGVRLKLPEIQGEGEAGEASHRTCPFPWRDLYVGSDGMLRPCQSSPLQLGSVFDAGNDFARLWNGPPMQELRHLINAESEKQPPGCRTCYHSSSANYNLRHSFLQLQEDFAPDWGRPAAPEPGLSGDGSVVTPVSVSGH